MLLVEAWKLLEYAFIEVGKELIDRRGETDEEEQARKDCGVGARHVVVTVLVQVLGSCDVRRPERPGALAEAVRSMMFEGGWAEMWCRKKKRYAPGREVSEVNWRRCRSDRGR